LDTSLVASGDFLSSLSEVLLSIEIVLLGLVPDTDFLVVLVVGFLENAVCVAALINGGGGLPLKGEYPSLPVVLCFSEGVDECEVCLLREVGEPEGELEELVDLCDNLSAVLKVFSFICLSLSCLFIADGVNCLSLACLFTTDGEPFVLSTGLVFEVERVCPGPNAMVLPEKSI